MIFDTFTEFFTNIDDPRQSAKVTYPLEEILFLTIALVVMFVGLLLWGFIAGDEGLKYDKIPKQLKSVILIAILVALFFGTLWAVGIEGDTFIGNIGDFLFGQEWSSAFWTNAAFIVVIVIALALVLKGTKGK